jgi:hypothetical protein
MTSANDPFAEVEPGWECWQGPQRDALFSRPDTTSSGLGEFLRSGEATKIIAATQPRLIVPRERGWSLASIPTFQAKHLGD